MAREEKQRELRNNSGEITSELDQGGSFVVTRAGQPVGELVPLRRHRFVPTVAAVAMFRGAPGIDYPTLGADLDRLAGHDATPRG